MKRLEIKVNLFLFEIIIIIKPPKKDFDPKVLGLAVPNPNEGNIGFWGKTFSLIPSFPKAVTI